MNQYLNNYKNLKKKTVIKCFDIQRSKIKILTVKYRIWNELRAKNDLYWTIVNKMNITLISGKRN